MMKLKVLNDETILEQGAARSQVRPKPRWCPQFVFEWILNRFIFGEFERKTSA